GQQWLASDLAGQYARLFDYLRTGVAAAGHYAYHYSDTLFLGVDARAYEAPERHRGWVELTTAQRDRLREAFSSALAALPAGQYAGLDSFLAHATFGRHNPLGLGLEPRRVSVSLAGVPVPPTDAARQHAGRLALEELVRTRLLPLGCLQGAADEA